MRLKMEQGCGAEVLGVAAAQHLGEGLNLLFAAALFAGLFKVALGANTLDDVLALELLLHATDRTVDGLVFADFDFDRHVNLADLKGKSPKASQSERAPSMAFFHL